MTAFKVVDTIARQTYTVADVRELSHTLDWITSGEEEITSYIIEDEIAAVLFLVDDGSPYVRSDVLGVSVEIEL